MIPVTIQDNFLKNPNQIRDYGLTLSFESDKKGQWAGKRSPSLHSVNFELFNLINLKVLSLFYDVENIRSFDADTIFQKASTQYNQSWIHQDNSILSYVLYLTPNPNINSGTSIYQIKDASNFKKHLHVDKRQDSFVINKELDDKFRLENNNQYVETIRIGNVYNRLVVFYGPESHASTTYDILDDDRLILLGFIHHVSESKSPVFRSDAYLI
jgi:hypothetical protein